MINFIGKDKKENFPNPHSLIQVDLRYLFGLMTNIYHWNNAQVGSHLQVRRFPDNHNRTAQNFLNFLTV